MVATMLPEYVTTNTRVEGGHLSVFNLHQLTSQQARELYAMSYAYSFARECGMLWDERNLKDARAFAAYVLVPSYISDAGIFRKNARFWATDEISDLYEVTPDLATYRKGLSRPHNGILGQFSDDEIRSLKRIFVEQ